MEDKKSFGAYICAKRKALGLTQREFAERLFLSESAVSKWERGLSYPDITMIHEICGILEVSEHELLTASEDVEARNAEKLAKRYLRLLRRVRVLQYVLYGGTALICLICNLAVGHTLDWFWVVLASLLLAASLTLLPTLVERHRGLITLGAFVLCLEVLMLVCGLVNRSLRWYPVAVLGTLLGFSVVFLPFVLRGVPLPPALADKKGLLYFGVNTGLILLLGLSARWYGHEGLSPLPWLPISLFSLLLPWGWFILIRYLPWNRWFRVACCLGLTGLYELVLNGVLDHIMVFSGYPIDSVYPNNYPSLLPAFDLTNWKDLLLQNGNILVVIALSFWTAAVVCVVIGVLRMRRQHD